MSQFIEDLLRPHVLNTALDDGYRAMAADADRKAQEWCNALTKNMNSEARYTNRRDLTVKLGKAQVFTSCDLFAVDAEGEKLVANAQTLLTVIAA
jgi:hypothetical protein